MSASITRASSRRPCSASSRARLIVARNSHALALIFCASTIASRKSASAGSECPCLSWSSPRSLSVSGRCTSSSVDPVQVLNDHDQRLLETLTDNDALDRLQRPPASDLCIHYC